MRKKKTQTFSRELKMPRLYREDLEKIEEIIKKELKPREYKLETKDYEYDGLKSIPRDNEQVAHFHIQTYNPYISIEFNRFSARVYAGDDDLNTTGALAKIVELLSTRERKILFWSQVIAMWLAPILFFAPIKASMEIGEIKSAKHWIALSVALSAAVWWIVSFYLRMHKFSEINFMLSKDNPSFIKRNKDQIILLLIGAIFGALATVFFTKLL